MPDESKREISPNRKALYYAGMGCSGIGLLLFLSVFLSMGSSNLDNHEQFRAQMDSEMSRSFGGMVLMMIGGGMMWVGRHGLAGSGILLDPRKARKDLEPWNRAAGGMTNDALDEIELAKKLGKKLDETAPAAAEPAEPVVKVRCRACKTLNDEHAKFCNQCGAAM